MVCAIVAKRRPIASASMAKMPQRKKIGILGGTGWPSTAHYYSELCRRSESRELQFDSTRPPTTPEMCIESLDLRYAVSLVGVDGDELSWQRFDDYHRIALKRLQSSGADFVVMASNTPHHRFSAIISGVDIPVLNLFEAVALHCEAEGHRDVFILGTALTMRSQVLRDAFMAKGINASAPVGKNHRHSVLALISTLQRGGSEDVARSIAALVRETTGCQSTATPAVCLACTELPLAFPSHLDRASFECDGIVYINPSVVHVEAALSLAFSDH